MNSSNVENLLKQANEKHSPPDVTSSVSNAERFYRTTEEAETAFQKFKEKLFLVEYWNKASEIASFAHYDENGKEQRPQKPFAVGSMIKITLPASGKDDWVKVLEINDAAPAEIIITLQPSFDPTIADAEGDKHTSHFFVQTSTNNFCLQRADEKLNFYVIGIGEQTNTEDSGGVLETIRNVATSNVGYFFGIQKTQWQTFCENFIETGEQS
jgi:hypothetical protein